ncbi:hypothetical protein ITP53_26510, partial [Nonomuraea sp. K274]|nr:hypothetical protein [Nonomuraea cypriaca]
MSGDLTGSRRARAVKVVVVLIGLLNLALAGVLIGLPGIRTTLDPTPGTNALPPLAAGLSRRPTAVQATPSPPAPPTGGLEDVAGPATVPPAESPAPARTTP